MAVAGSSGSGESSGGNLYSERAHESHSRLESQNQILAARPLPLLIIYYYYYSLGPLPFEVSMCPGRRTVNGKSICPASVNHVSYRLDLVVSLNWSTVARRATRTLATRTSLDSPHNPTDLA